MTTMPFWHDIKTIWVDGNIRCEDIWFDISVTTYIIQCTKITGRLCRNKCGMVVWKSDMGGFECVRIHRMKMYSNLQFWYLSNGCWYVSCMVGSRFVTN